MQGDRTSGPESGHKRTPGGRKLASSLFDMVSPPNKTVSDTMSSAGSSGAAAAAVAPPPTPKSHHSHPPDDPMKAFGDEDVDVVLGGVDDVEAVISDTFLINCVDT